MCGDRGKLWNYELPILPILSYKIEDAIRGHSQNEEHLMTLRISLRDGEPVIVNGAVLRACGRTQLHLENEATILRGRDVMKPEEATSPAKRLYFACMMAYIDPKSTELHRQAILTGLEDLIGALSAHEAKAYCVRFAQKVAAGNFWAALADCRWLISYEADALARLEPASLAGVQDDVAHAAPVSAASLA